MPCSIVIFTTQLHYSTRTARGMTFKILLLAPALSDSDSPLPPQRQHVTIEDGSRTSTPLPPGKLGRTQRRAASAHKRVSKGYDKRAHNNVVPLGRNSRLPTTYAALSPPIGHARARSGLCPRTQFARHPYATQRNRRFAARIQGRREPSRRDLLLLLRRQELPPWFGA